jgi:cation:H+ antiporter
MTILSATCIFALCFALMTISSFILGGSLEKLKTRFRLSGGLLGMIAALGADTPEISSAVTALIVGQHDVGVGIIIGSNIFNIAALLGLSALVAGKIPVRRQGVIFNGAISFVVTLVLILLIFRIISPLVSIVLLMLLLVPYVIVSSLKLNQMKQWRLPEKIRTFLIAPIAYARHASKGHKMVIWKSCSGAWLGGPAVIIIIATSMGMVHSAIFLSNAWGVNKTIVGMLILATLTSIPNVITTIKLALDGRGIAVTSEALNSNTINILFGICVPATILGLGSLARQTIFSVWWLIGMTITALYLLYFKKGFTRTSGAIIVGLYLVFVVIIIGWK